LLRSNAACRQSCRLLQLWCSGKRCWETGLARGSNITCITLTSPQNWDLQCGHWPTIRSAAELQGVSDWSWQRFLAGMADVCIGLGKAGYMLGNSRYLRATAAPAGGKADG
jgi:hypothetical protein